MAKFNDVLTAVGGLKSALDPYLNQVTALIAKVDAAVEVLKGLGTLPPEADALVTGLQEETAAVAAASAGVQAESDKLDVIVNPTPPTA